MSYGKSWEKFPIEPGELWGCGNNFVGVFDITRYYPDIVKKADMIYCDPPWSLGNVNMFNSKAGRVYMDSFNEFYFHLFKMIKYVNPKVAYIEIGAYNLDLFVSEMKNIFKVVDFWEIRYYKKNKCFLIRGGGCTCGYNYTGIDDSLTPYVAIKNESPNIVLDMCMGRGITALAAIENGCNFMGTELNKRKLAVCIERMYKNGIFFKKHSSL